MKFKYMTFDPTLSLSCLSTVIMAYSEKLSDIIVYEKCEVNMAFVLA